MSIGTITSTGKQNASVAGGLKYKKIQKGEASFCFLADDTVVDFASLVSFILTHGGVIESELQTEFRYRRKSAIMCAGASITESYLYDYTTLVVTQQKSNVSDAWSTPTEIKAVGFRDSSSPYVTWTIDATWTVV